MRLSTRLVTNASSTFVRLGSTFVLGLFTTWYMLGKIGVVGFGLIALATSSSGVAHALERTLRFGLVRELAASIAQEDPAAVRRSVTSAFRLCLQALALVAVLTLVLAGLAWFGLFSTPDDQPRIQTALVVLILCEGFHAGARLLSAPYIQALFAAQYVALDNALMILGRLAYAASAVIVFGWVLPDAGVAFQLMGFAVSRATLQLGDVALGIWIARRKIPGVEVDRRAFDEEEYRAVRHTVWQSSQVAVLMNLNPQFMAVLINLFFGLTYNGIWQIVVQFSGFARMLAEGLLRGIAPLVTKLQATGKEHQIVGLMARSIRYQFGIALPCVVVLGLWARPLLELWVGGRLAADAGLLASGIDIAAALQLATTMAVLLLIMQTLRAGFFGVERTLYGIGKVSSYAWFSKWTTLVALTSAALLMAWLDDPIVAPAALLGAYLLYSPGVVLMAAKREAGLSLVAAWRSISTPLIANAIFLALLVPMRWKLPDSGAVSLGVVFAVAASIYLLLCWKLVLEAGERKALLAILRLPAAATDSRAP